MLLQSRSSTALSRLAERFVITRRAGLAESVTTGARSGETTGPMCEMVGDFSEAEVRQLLQAQVG